MIQYEAPSEQRLVPRAIYAKQRLKMGLLQQTGK